ncbi:MAG: hypothetical protein ACE5JL_15295, partial [Dehalococcoidia bacterium]
PHYELEFNETNSRGRFLLSYTGKDIIWWADIPGVFTYFASFGRFSGSMTHGNLEGAEDSHQAPDQRDHVPITGVGCFEHGFARKPFNFDKLWLPVRLLKALIPSFRPVRYHYELCFGDGTCHGGFMYARAFGIVVRNRGGLYVNDGYTRIHSVKITYLDDSEPDATHPGGAGRPQIGFHRQWRVRALTDGGAFEYVATREWPSAPVASNMVYYYFVFKGTLNGQSISGRGYGEYVRI